MCAADAFMNEIASVLSRNDEQRRLKFFLRRLEVTRIELVQREVELDCKLAIGVVVARSVGTGHRLQREKYEYNGEDQCPPFDGRSLSAAPRPPEDARTRSSLGLQLLDIRNG